MDDIAPLAAKHPRSSLAGPYGHPFHPILVTVPIGAWTASLVFDLIAFFVDDPAPYLLGAQVLIAIGVAGALVAAIFGFLDLSVIPAGTRAKRTAVTHMSLNLGVVVVFVVDFLLRVAAGHDAVPVIGVLLTVIGMAVLGFSGYLGGMLAYRYGVRVATEETQAEGFRRSGR